MDVTSEKHSDAHLFTDQSKFFSRRSIAEKSITETQREKKTRRQPKNKARSSNFRLPLTIMMFELLHCVMAGPSCYVKKRARNFLSNKWKRFQIPQNAGPTQRQKHNWIPKN